MNGDFLGACFSLHTRSRDTRDARNGARATLYIHQFCPETARANTCRFLRLVTFCSPYLLTLPLYYTRARAWACVHVSMRALVIGCMRV